MRTPIPTLLTPPTSRWMREVRRTVRALPALRALKVPGALPTLRALKAPTARLREDRGSATAAVLIFALVFLALAAFVVDGGLSISKRERAADIAEQAARFAAQDIDVEQLRNAPAGTPPVINTADCTDRVRTFAAQSGLDDADVAASGCTDAQPDRVEVIVQITYRPMLTGFFYDRDQVVHGTAAAESITGPAG